MSPFDALPPVLLRAIMLAPVSRHQPDVLALPVDARARAACVCRSWRAFWSDPSLWQVLDLTPAGGVARRVTENLVRGAVARAAGQLRVLHFDLFEPGVRFLIGVIQSDGAELQQVNTEVVMDATEVEAVFAAAPRLQVLNARVVGSCELMPMLRNEPPYGPLRVSHLTVRFDRDDVEADVLALAAAVAAHESLKGLSLMEASYARGVNALLDAAAERCVDELELDACNLDAESMPALARLLQRGSLTTLFVFCDDFPHAQEESMPVLCAALRECRKLMSLNLTLKPLDGATRRTVGQLLDAVAMLPALQYLCLSGSDVQDNVATGEALGALLRANLPNLRYLSGLSCLKNDEGAAPLLDGLAANTHLRELDCLLEDNDLSEEFYEDRLKPALAVLAARAALDA